MTGNTLEQRARELLAAEMDAIGSSIAAGMLRDGWPASGATVPALRAIEAALRLSAGADARNAACKWWQQDEGYDTFSTSCGHEYTVNDCNDGNPNLPFCPYCAKRVEGHAWHPGDDAAPRHEPGEVV